MMRYLLCLAFVAAGSSAYAQTAGTLNLQGPKANPALPQMSLSGLSAAINAQLAGKQDAGTSLLKTQNLGDVGSAATARTNLGLGGLSVLGVGTGLASGSGSLSVTYGSTSGTAAQGNDSRITGALQGASNLSDLGSAPTARTNLGLGTAATVSTGTSGAVIPLLNGANTWSGAQNFNGAISASQKVEVSDGSSHFAGTTLTFQTFSALKAFQPTNVGSNMISATSAGYYAAGDGGGAVYDWNATSSAVSDGLFTIAPTGWAGNGRWTLRIPGGGFHPEQVGAHCDGSTDDASVLNSVTNALSAAHVYSGTIALSPGRWCVISSATWTTPMGFVVTGGSNPTNQTTNVLDVYSNMAGFYVAPSVTIKTGRSSVFEKAAVLRQGLQHQPQTFSDVQTAVTQWASEAGATTAIVPTGGSSGTGCSVNDILYLSGGTGTPAVVKVSSVSGGAVTGLTTLRAGNYLAFPTSPVSSSGSSATNTTTCTALPTFTVTAGTPRSVGVWLGAQDAHIRDVLIVGFNVAVFGAGQRSDARNVTFDSANGFDIMGVSDNAYFEDLHGIGMWSASASGSGAISVAAVPTPGTLNQAGDVLTVQGGSCTTQPQVTIDTVSSGGIATAHVSTYGQCSSLPSNPVTLNNLHGGSQAQLTVVMSGGSYRPGDAFYFHDQCDGCQLRSLTQNGWVTGLHLSNVWSLDINSFVSEPVSTNTSGLVPNYGLLAENSTTAVIWHAHTGGAWVGMQMNQTDSSHATIPPNYVGANLGGSITVIGGESGCVGTCQAMVSTGPYSSGVLQNFGVSASTTPVNIGANATSWSLWGITSSVTNWLTVDSTSRAAVKTDIGIAANFASAPTINGVNTMVIGTGATATGNSNSSIAMGVNSAVNSLRSVAIGNGATDRANNGSLVFSGSPFTTNGDLQIEWHLLRATSTGVTAVTLSENGGGAGNTNIINMAANVTYSGRIMCHAKNTSNNGDVAVWSDPNFLLTSISGSTVLQTSAMAKVFATAGASAWAFSEAADATNHGLNIQFTGAASTTIRAACKVDLMELQ